MGRMRGSYVTTGGSPVPLAGINTTTGLSQLDASARGVTEVVIQAHPDNGNNVLVGNHAVRSIVLVPGAGITINIDALNKIWISQQAGDQTGWFASSH